jgi:hypothetical protein
MRIDEFGVYMASGLSSTVGHGTDGALGFFGDHVRGRAVMPARVLLFFEPQALPY